MHNYSMHRIELRLRLVWRVSVRQHSLRMPKCKKYSEVLFEEGTDGGMERHAKGIKIRKVQILRCRQYVNIR